MLPGDVKHLAADSSGSVFASDGGQRIACLAGGWLVNIGLLPAEARISALTGLHGGGVAVADAGLHRIWTIDARGRVVALAGVEQPPGLHRKIVRSDGRADEARFRSPSALTSNEAGELFVVEPGGDRTILRTISGGLVSSAELDLISETQVSGLGTVGEALYAVFGSEGPPAVVVLRRNFAAVHAGSDVIWTRGTVIGSRTLRGSADGPASEARFAAPSAIAARPGACVVADGARLRRISSENRVDTMAGSVPGYLDGHGASARFARLRAVAALPDDEFLVADPENEALRLVSADGEVSTVIGAMRSDRISNDESAVLSKAFGNALVDDDVREAWGIARVFLRDHRMGADPWPDRTVQPTSVASTRLGKGLAEAWSVDNDPDRSAVGTYCRWLIGCEERAIGVNDIRDHKLKAMGDELDRKVG